MHVVKVGVPSAFLAAATQQEGSPTFGASHERDLHVLVLSYASAAIRALASPVHIRLARRAPDDDVFLIVAHAWFLLFAIRC